ncbi:unnamed protein product, partial [Mesorhabditis belari]|uniref:Uncharacterized protein n=1 Tax=Mesorhabditis belari TaxID=2138241 RepID=A0AAF3F833_9BILA
MSIELVSVDSFPIIQSWLSIFSVPALFFNLLGVYIIYVGTPKRLGSYKYYLLTMQLTGAVFDFGLIFFTFPISATPILGGYFLGLASSFGVSTISQFVSFVD